jgi:hypothetical protein
MHVVKALPKIVAVLFFVVATCVIIGGLLSDASDLISDPKFGFLIFLFLLALLAAVEALHISVTLLRLEPQRRARRVLAQLRPAQDLPPPSTGPTAFLAGRQLFVIVAVYFAARLTSFLDMETVPLFYWQFRERFRKLCLEYGIAGALFLLWYSQLILQFLANRRPKALKTAG